MEPSSKSGYIPKKLGRYHVIGLRCSRNGDEVPNMDAISWCWTGDDFLPR
jgi:hypothetical protein